MKINGVEVSDLNWNTPDVHGFTPHPEMIGHSIEHTGNGKEYTITGFCWLGASDEWGYESRMFGQFGPTISRPLSHLAGCRENGERRYHQWSVYTRYHVPKEYPDPEPID